MAQPSDTLKSAGRKGLQGRGGRRRVSSAQVCAARGCVVGVRLPAATGGQTLPLAAMAPTQGSPPLLLQLRCRAGRQGGGDGAAAVSCRRARREAAQLHLRCRQGN
jgi:hypothetical protein